MTSQDPLSIFAACAPGLEPLLAAELGPLGAHNIRVIPGGVEFEGGREVVYRVNLCSGLASHVRVRVGRFEARHFGELVRKVSRVDWSQWLEAGVPVSIHATSRRSKLYHTGAVEDRVREGIGGVGTEPTGEDVGVAVHARLDRDRCELSVDTSGEPLHRRGWRLQTGKAPLREDLARALLLVSGWDPETSLVDPMMGSGTIVIEAATIARRLAPGRGRSFAFERAAFFDAKVWETVRKEAEVRERPSLPGSIVGRDRIRGGVEASVGNATRAGVLSDLEIEQSDLLETELPAVQALVTNPPYGQRIGRGSRGEVDATWRRLGAAVRAQPSIRRVGVVVPDRRFVKLTGLALRPRLLTDHGGTKVEFMTCDGPSSADPPD